MALYAQHGGGGDDFSKMIERRKNFKTTCSLGKSVLVTVVEIFRYWEMQQNRLKHHGMSNVGVFGAGVIDDNQSFVFCSPLSTPHIS